MRSRIDIARKRLRKRAVAHGTTVTLYWHEHATEPSIVEPTTGSALDQPSTEKSCDLQVFLHAIAPSQSSYKAFAEIQSGDCIMDLPERLVRITDAGTTDLTVGDVVTETTLDSANVDVSTAATGTEVALSSLANAWVVINDERWVQKQAGGDLTAVWDATFGGQKLAESVLLRRG